MISETKSHSPVLVTGATSQIGHFLLPRLTSSDYEVYALSRRDKSLDSFERPTIKWLKQDISHGLNDKDFNHCATLIHIAPLHLLPDIIEQASIIGVKRIIAFGSTSVFTKKDSQSAMERDIAIKLAETEHSIQVSCDQLSIRWTLFRPTMIYGCGLDKNVTTIGNFIQSFGFFPVVERANGLRQPVHADDLATACLAALDSPNTLNRSYNLSGGNVLTYWSMVEKIFIGLGKKPRIISIPLSLYRAALNIVYLIKRDSGLTAEMANRMTEDFYFDHNDAKRDFGYSPRGFIFE
jgi:nucleoside-diphosphate-sugar epimerase